MDQKLSKKDAVLINASEQWEDLILTHLFSALENLSKNASTLCDVKAIIKLSKFIKKILNDRNYFIMINHPQYRNDPPNSGQNNI